jgi:TM2 domain-containing membrane protein YozV
MVIKMTKSRRNDKMIKLTKEKARALKLYELRKKSPGAAAGLSLLITGAGHWYMGKVGKGFLLLAIQLFLWCFLLGWIMWIVVPIMAYSDAKKINTELQIELNLDED